MTHTHPTTAEDDAAARRALSAQLSGELDRLAAEAQSLWGVVTSFIAAGLVAAGALFGLDNDTEPWQWGFVGSVPLVLLAYGVLRASKTAMVSYYRRAVEHRIYELHEADRLVVRRRRLPPTPLFEHISVAFESNRRGIPQVRTIASLVYASLATLVFGCTIVTLLQVETWQWRVGLGSLYGVLTVATVSLALETVIHGRRMWLRLTWRVTRDLQLGARFYEQRHRQRPLWSYLVMPRPNDFIVKTVMLHGVATLLGWWMVVPTPSFGTAMLRGGTVLLCFEYLMYQSRYMVNDWRGMANDQSHPAAHIRSRLPTLDTSARKAWFWVAVILRVVLGLGLPFVLVSMDEIFTLRNALELAAASLTVWILAWGYEVLRFRPHPLNVRPGALHVTVAVLYSVVGISYGVRAVMGVWFGSGYEATAALLALVFTTFYLYGICIVLMTWALEAVIFLDLDEPTTVGAPRSFDAVLLREKPHLLPLLAVLGYLSEDVGPRAPSRVRRRKGTAVLADRGEYRLPWNSLIVASIALAAAVGVGLRDGLPFHAGWHSVAAAVAAAVAGLVMVRRPAVGLALVGGVIAGIVGENWRSASGRQFLAVIPLAAVTGVYACTRTMSYEEVVGLATSLRRAPRIVARRLAYAFRELAR